MKEQEIQYEVQQNSETSISSKKKIKTAEAMRKNIVTNSAEEENKELGTTKMAINEQTDSNNKAVEGTNVTNNSRNERNRNEEENNDKKDTKKTNKGGNTNNSNKNNNNGSSSKTRVNIMTPGEMAMYTFTISWRPDQKVGQDGNVIIRMLMREMVHRTPQIIFHPTNSASSSVPRDINNINNDFPTMMTSSTK
jgi:hypothetical protein